MARQKIIGVYLILNIINNKKYIGSSINIEHRKYEHFLKLKNNIHNNRYLQRAFNKYGEENFKFIIIELVENKDKLLEREQYWMDLYKVSEKEFGYNLVINAGNNLGLKFSQEARLKLSQSHKGLCAGEKHPLYGKHHSEKTKDKMKISNGGKNNGFYGKKHTEESKQKMSKSSQGKNLGEKNPSVKLTEQKVKEIKLLLKEENFTQKQIADMFNVGKTVINYIKKGKTWSYVKLEEIN